MLNSLLRGVGPRVYHRTFPGGSLLVPAAALRAPGLRVLVIWAAVARAAQCGGGVCGLG